MQAHNTSKVSAQVTTIKKQHFNNMQSWIEILQYWVNICMNNATLECISRMGIPFFSKRYDLARICAEGHSPHMTCQIAEAICHLPNSHSVASAIAHIQELPDIDAIELLLSRQVNIARGLSSSNLRRSLRHIQDIHNVSSRLHHLKNTTVSYEQIHHVQVLDRLWFAAFPNKIDFFEDWSERDWGNIGFQKKNDPVSDLRGLGLLGLQQLVYFFETRPLESREILKIAHLEHAYFPLAATALSIGAFSLALLKEHRLHRKLLTALDTYELIHSLPSPNEKEQEEEHKDKLIMLQNVCFETFCDLLERFTILWQTENATNVMDFPRVFTLLQQETRRQYPRLEIALDKTNGHSASVGHTAASIIL